MGSIKLDPGSGGQCIATGALQEADIIVSTTGAWSSAAIRIGTWSDVSHAMLYAGAGRVIEAVGDGVRTASLHEALVGARLAVAYRRNGMNAAAGGAVVRYATAQVGKGYDYGGAAQAGLQGKSVVCVVIGGLAGLAACEATRRGTFSSPDKFFCSELVFAAFRKAGFPISAEDPSTAPPQSVVRAYAHGTLSYVGHLKA